jgi:signal transduction histidine kinase
LAQAVGAAVPVASNDDQVFDRRSIEVLARVAHEGRQPLSAARAAFELLRQSPDVRRTRACDVMDRQLVRLARLFDDLLEASRLGQGQTILHVEQIDLQRLVAEVVEAVRPFLVEKHQRLAMQLPEEPVWMAGDPVRLQQVTSNLLVNGIKYTDPGGRVSVALAAGAADVVLTVSDTGRGIGPETLPHIFEPFRRGDDAPGEGLGLGLAIARQLVELHGGTICASSAGIGYGSEFVVTLPTRPSEHREQTAEKARQPSSSLLTS